MTKKTLSETFTNHSADASFVYAGPQQVIKTSDVKGGTLMTHYHFEASDPYITVKLKTGDEVKTLEEKRRMADVGSRELSEAYIALRQLGGDPFTLQAQIHGGDKAPKSRR